MAEPGLPHASPILSIDEEKERIRQRMREDRDYLRMLDGIREKFPKALTAEYVYEKIALQKQRGIKAIPTGIDWWDEWAGPFRRANLYCFAGYQGTGKTSFLVNLTWPMAQRGVRIWNVCMELTAEETFEVVAEHVLGKTGLDEGDLTTAYATIQPTGYRFFEPERDKGWKETLEIICDTVLRDKIDVVIIDNFSYLTTSGRDSYEVERMVAKALKGLSQELEIPILVIAHLRKPDRDDTEPEPTAHSVLGSGAITQVASDTFILHHPLTGNEEQSRHPVGYVLSGKPRWTMGGKRYVHYAGFRRSFTPSTVADYKRQFPEKTNNNRRMR